MRLTFDRGTLLLHDLPDSFDGIGVAELRFDRRVGEWRAPAYVYAKVHHALIDRGFAVLDEVPSSWPLPLTWQPIDLRDYQRRALTGWEKAGRRGVICLPTGSGKTRVALAAMATTRLRTLCLAPTRALVEQWRREIAVFYPGPVGWYGDGWQIERPITVATFAGARLHLHRLGGRFDLIVIDEAHHVGSLAGTELLEMSVARCRLGLTATPPRDAETLEEMTRLVGPEAFTAGLAELSGEAVAAFDHIILALELSPAERSAYERERQHYLPFFQYLRQTMPQASWGTLTRAASSSPEGSAALAAWRRSREATALTESKSRTLADLLERHRDARVLVFTADNSTACAIARRHLVQPITCDVSRHEREQALARFRTGEIRALVSTAALNEGIDVPAADVAILTGGGGGEREYAQRIGRVLRPAAGKVPVVYELIARDTFEVSQSQRRREAFATRAAGVV